MVRPGSSSFLSLLTGIVALLLFVSQQAVVVRSEIIPLSLVLAADSDEVHFVRGWLESPAHVDLSQIKFLTTDVPTFDDDFFTDEDDTPNDAFDDDDDTNAPDDNFNDDDNAVSEGTPSPSVAPGDGTTAPGDGDLATPSPSSATSSGGDGADGSGGEVVVTQAPEPAPGGGDNAAPSEGAGQSESSSSPAPSPADAANEAATIAPTGTGDRRRRRTRNLEEGNSEAGAGPGGGGPKVRQVLDVVIFLIPEDCLKNRWGGCDWSALGVGVEDEDSFGGLTYCCSENAVASNQCTSDMMGRLLVNPSLFQGEHRTVEVPTEADQEFRLPNPIFEIDVTGDYVLILANCDDYGMDVFSLGSMEWKSVKGFLPGELFGLMFFYAGLTVIYLILFLWYWGGMRMYQDAAIPIQKFILGTIILGLIEFFLRAVDLGSWNTDGLRSMGIIWTAVVIGVLKRGLTRCLFVMVSMGWGVVRDSLGMALVRIVILGITYSGLTMLRDFFLVLAVDKVQSWSSSAEETLLNLTMLVSLGVLAVNLIFFFWIISSLMATTEYLKNMNQTSKLRRHLRLRCIIMTAFAFSLMWFIFSIVDGVIGVLSSDQVWMLEATMHVNNLFVIVSVAILWRPNSNAKDYAMQMEIPAMGDDGENELELSCVVPSAGEFDDGNDPDHPNGLPVDDAVVS